MATTYTTRAMINDTDANFRLWGKAISDQFAAGGWTKTADTGQIDWTTVVKPASNNTVQGYEMWSSNDAGGGLVNFYVKIEYGASNLGTTGSAISIWVTVGWATDGAGNLTGPTTTRKQLIGNTTPVTTLQDFYLSSGTGWIHISLGSLSSHYMFFAIERTRSSTLAVQNEICIIANHGSGLSGTSLNQVCTPSNAFYAFTTAEGAILTGASNAVQNGVCGISFVCGIRGYFTNPLLGLLMCPNNALSSPGGTVSLTIYNATHTYMVRTPQPQLMPHASGSYNPLIRWE